MSMVNEGREGVRVVRMEGPREGSGVQKQDSILRSDVRLKGAAIHTNGSMILQSTEGAFETIFADEMTRESDMVTIADIPLTRRMV